MSDSKSKVFIFQIDGKRLAIRGEEVEGGQKDGWLQVRMGGRLIAAFRCEKMDGYWEHEAEATA